MKRLTPEEQQRLEQYRRRAELTRVRRIHSRTARAYEVPLISRKNLVVMPDGVERFWIHVPQIFSFDQNYEQSAAVVNSTRYAVLNQRTPVFLDFSDVDFVGAAAALVLTAEIFRSRYSLILPRGKRTVSGSYPKNQISHKILDDLGFYKAIKVETDQAPSSLTSHIHIGMQPFSRIDAEQIEKFRDIFLTPFPQLEQIHRQRLQGAVVEAVSNAFEHAFKGQGDFRRIGQRAWLSGYLDLTGSEFMMMVFDQGLGIPRTLDPTIADRLRALGALKLAPSESETIAAATEIYRTSTGQAGRGRGFQTMKRFIDICEDGELRVFSNRGKFVYTRTGSTVVADTEQSVGGTLIQWRIRHKAREIAGVE